MLTDILYKCDSTGKIRTYQIEIDDDKYRMITGTKDGKKVESKWTVCTPKNVGKSNVTTGSSQAILEAQARIDKKLVSNYYITEAECVANPEQFFSVMLATEWDKIRPAPHFPLLIDPKLDGMRLVEKPDNSYSRKGKPIPSARFIDEELQPFFIEYPTITLDGEIYSHDLKSDFNELMSIARKQNPDEAELETAKNILQYHVYDLFDESNPDMNAFDRKIYLTRILPISNRIHLVDCKKVTNAEELKKLNGEHIQAGYEGSIARTPLAAYDNKRSKNLIKIKQFITEEFIINDILEGTGNRSGIAGTVVIYADNVRVGCGVKGTWKHAKELLDNKANLVGKLATIRHFGKTPDGSLRFPVCVDVNRTD
jgi:ATP-dependent DNA ligase